MNQRGFATLEVILMVMVIGILASIAVPRFTSVTTAANTAKIQADLTTIDTAIAMYILEKGTTTAPTWDNVKGYLQDGDKVKPPTGSAYVNGTAEDINDTSYAVTSTNDGYRATLKMKTTTAATAGDFTTSSTSGGGSGSNTSGGSSDD